MELLEDKLLYVHSDTLQCIRRGCVPCIYKVCVHGGPFAKPNIRPENCLRFPREEEDDGEVSKDVNHKVRGIYRNDLKILTVGDGNFSFSLSLQQGLALASGNLIATSYEEYDSLKKAYTDAITNISELQKNGVKVLHGIDAGKLHSYTSLGSGFDVIVWNFPCIASEVGADAQWLDIEANRQLLLAFFKSAPHLLSKHGEIHVTHKTKAPFGEWKMVDLAMSSGLKLNGAVVFDKCVYPEYINKKALTSSSFPSCDSLHYVFSKDDMAKGNIFFNKQSAKLGPLDEKMVQIDTVRKEKSKVKKAVFKEVVDMKGGKKESKKRKRSSLKVEDRDIYEEGFEYDEDTLSGGEEELKSIHHHVIAPEWSELDVILPFKLVHLTQPILKAVRLLLLDKEKLSESGLEHNDQKKLMEMLSLPRSQKIPAKWEDVGRKRKRVENTTKKVFTNPFSSLVNDDSDDEDED